MAEEKARSILSKRSFPGGQKKPKLKKGNSIYLVQTTRMGGSMVAWDHKQCKCKICEEKAKCNGEPIDVFNSISEGKTHVFIFHRIAYAKAREYLILTSGQKEKIIRIGEQWL